VTHRFFGLPRAALGLRVDRAGWKLPALRRRVYRVKSRARWVVFYVAARPEVPGRSSVLRHCGVSSLQRFIEHRREPHATFL
jgi:hypothetical protein